MGIIYKLGPFLQKKSIRAETLPDFEKIDVLGVSNQVGITTTGHKKSKDLSKYQLIEKGDFAYNPYRINVGSIGLVTNGIRGLVSPAYVVFSTNNKKLLPDLLFDFLKSKEGLFQIGKYARGTVRKALRFSDLCQIEMPIPSLEIQRKITEKKIRIQPVAEKLKNELTHQKTLLKKLRQQILQEAIQGKLTADFRAQNPGIEPASELLARIKAEKEQLINEKKIKQQKTLPPISEEEIPFELPERWVWCRLGEVSINSLGKMLDSQKNKGELKPYLRNLNVQWFKMNISDLKKMPFEEHETQKYSVINGDIVICEGGYPGQAAIWERDDQIMFQKALHRVRFISKCFHSVLFVHILWLWDANGEIIKHYTGAGIQHLTGKSLNKMLIPFPPLHEQKAIVTKVEKLLAICDQLETQITTNQTHTEQLMQAVLKEAFSQSGET